MRAGHIARQQRPRGTVGSLRNGLGCNCGAAPRLTDNRTHRSAPISPSQEIGRLIPGSAAARSGCCGVVVWARGPMVASCHSDRVPPTNAPTSRCCGGSLVPRRAADAAARQVWPVVVPGAVPAPRRAEQPHRHLRGKSDPRGHREPQRWPRKGIAASWGPRRCSRPRRPPMTIHTPGSPAAVAPSPPERRAEPSADPIPPTAQARRIRDTDAWPPSKPTRDR